MNVVRENLENQTALLRVTVGEADYKEQVEKQLKDYKRKANVPGFRPGMVPAGLIRKMYGRGILADEINKLLQELNQVIAAGMNVVITAHAQLKKQELPDEIGAFDRWELKLERRDSAMIKEWADLLLFADYKTTVVTDSNNHAKAQGGERVMYTTHKPTWDAKNRLGLPDQLPFQYSGIKGPLEQAMGLSDNVVPVAITDLMASSKLPMQGLQDILFQGKFVATGTPMSQVPDQVWQHIEQHWSEAMNFYQSLQSKEKEKEN